VANGRSEKQGEKKKKKKKTKNKKKKVNQMVVLQGSL
jgi:hypothetical protein